MARRSACLAVLLPALAACATSTAVPTPRAPWLRGADCLDPGTARNWHEVSTTELLVDAGRRKYRITLAASCLRIGGGPVLVFDGDPVSGRVCGVPGDAVVLDGQRCPIERLELVDPGTWHDAANDGDGELHGEAPVR